MPDISLIYHQAKKNPKVWGFVFLLDPWLVTSELTERGVDVLTWLILQLSVLSCKHPVTNLYFTPSSLMVGI